MKIFQIYDIEVAYSEGILLGGMIFISNNKSVLITNPFIILKHFFILDKWREQQIDKILENV